MSTLTRRTATAATITIGSILAVTSCGNGSSAGADGADNFPEETITLVTSFGPGGANDTLNRLLAEQVGDSNDDFDFVVENIEGGGGSVGQAEVSQAEADGYTQLLITPSVIINPMTSDLPYEHDDFAPISLLNNDPHLLAVNTDLPIDDFDSFVEYAQENPGELTIGTAGTTSSTGFTTSLLASEVEITPVPHDGGSDSVLQAEGGHIDGSVVGGLSEIAGAMESGNLEPIAVFADERMEDIPDVPTATERGIDVIGSSWRGVVAPADTDPAIIDRLDEVYGEAIESDEFVESMENLQLVHDYRGPEEFQALIDDTYETYTELSE